ncbi:type VI secretion protein [Streptomyces sp. NPDC053560]|uniref:type VI secretion protein n=1 Tax=Streptomyces sp. NPDC053560 TaxID=3365711 RepID=UPI0037CE6DB9
MSGDGYDRYDRQGHAYGEQGPGGPGRDGGAGPRRRERGVPDSLLVGVLAFLLGLTVLVWLATGLSGLFAHGGWPDHLTFTRTPLAMRELVTEPHDLAGAWPATPAGQLSGYGLFWGVLISELMVLVVLTVFVLGTVTRFRAVRAQRRAERNAARGHVTGEAPGDAQRPVPMTKEPQAGQPGQTPPATVPAPAPSATPAPAPASEGAETAVGAGTAAAAAATVPTVAPAPQQAADARTEVPAPAAPAEARTNAPTPGPADAAGTSAVSAAGDAAGAAGAAGSIAALGAAGTGPAAPPPTPVGGGSVTEAAAGAALPRVHYHHRTERPAARAAALDVINAAEGPLLVATTDPTLWAESKDARAKLGPLHVYDPLHALDTPARLRWSPTAGCTDIAVAGTRAAALLAPVRPASTLDSALADAAETLLRCWLHAAAVDGRPFRQIHRWAQGSGAAHEPVRILRTNSKAASGRAGELESVLTAHPERRDMAQQLVARALAALSSVHIRDACNPGRADALALESFVGEGGTLYVVGEPLEDPRTTPGAMPLLTALVSSVVERGRRMAERSSDGRLDPPLTLVLDDIAALAPLPALPELISSGATQGLLTLATLRSPEQARARWPHAALPA